MEIDKINKKYQKYALNALKRVKNWVIITKNKKVVDISTKIWYYIIVL